MCCEEVGDEFVCVLTVVFPGSDPNAGTGADVSVSDTAGSGDDDSDDDDIDDDKCCFDLVEVVVVVGEDVVKQ